MNKKLKSKKVNTNKGITLIALIITIIVLLILAVVAIRAVQGDGILAHARNARDDYQAATANEQEILQNYTDYITEQSGNNPPDVGTYVKVAVNEKATDNGTINGKATNENNPIIPKDFIPIDTETSSWGDGSSAPDAQSVKNGLVIKDEYEDEFVWIPVASINEMARETSGTDANGRKNYQGILYDFPSATTATEKTDYGQGTSSYREPDVVTNASSGAESTAGNEYDAVEANLNKVLDDNHKTTKTAASFKAQLQEEFNGMVESVAKYKGFYVGRYEMDEYGFSVKGEVSQGNTSDDGNWYGLYSNAKSLGLLEYQNVTTEMIWGCQYDAMMRWMQKNDIDVTSPTPTDTGRGKEASKNTNSEHKTGEEPNDRLNNVYDLLGNRSEWTQQASNTYVRAYRGSSSNGGNPPKNSAAAAPTRTLRWHHWFTLDTLCKVAMNAK